MHQLCRPRLPRGNHRPGKPIAGLSPQSAHVPSRREEGPRRSNGHATAGENDGSVMSSMPRASDLTDQDGGKVSGTVQSVNTTLGRPGRVAGSG